MGKAYLKIPGHFVFCEEVNRNRSAKEERDRLRAMVTTALDKYFNFEDRNNDKFNKYSENI